MLWFDEILTVPKSQPNLRVETIAWAAGNYASRCPGDCGVWMLWRVFASRWDLTLTTVRMFLPFRLVFRRIWYPKMFGHGCVGKDGIDVFFLLQSWSWRDKITIYESIIRYTIIFVHDTSWFKVYLAQGDQIPHPSNSDIRCHIMFMFKGFNLWTCVF